jgi:acetolactate synthase-1/2/3 large subunit
VKYSDLIGEWLAELGYTHCFFVAGGGIMHLLDGVRNRFKCIPVVHEVTAGICAEHFNECASKNQRAFALVTTGPGLTNIVSSIAGCYVEHRELLVIAGQVKSTDMLTAPERQRGVQEVDGTSICSPISVHSECLRTPITRSSFKSLVKLSQGPHPGPVVIEVCLDVQGAAVDPNIFLDDEGSCGSTLIPPIKSELDEIVRLLKTAQRPLILLGGLVSRRVARTALPVFERLNLPVATTTSAIDRVPTASPVYAGRPGTWGGQRAANLVLAQSDLILAFGAQLDLQQTGFNYREYAPQAKLVHIFPSQAELDRIGPPAYAKILASPDAVITSLISNLQWEDKTGWAKFVHEVRSLVPNLEPANTNAPGFVNSFRFLNNLSRATQASDVLALCSSGGTFTGSLQNYEIATGQLATTSAAHASMGYGLATAIGAAFADASRRVVLTEGEGGFSQNLQELAIIKHFSLPIKIFLFENQGYASIRATQKKFFNGAYLGCDPETGLGFPNWEKLFDAYDIPCRYLTEEESTECYLGKLLNERIGPEAWVIRIDPNQPNWPAVSTVLAANGSLTSSPIYDMNPKLSDEIMSRVGRYLPDRQILK